VVFARRSGRLHLLGSGGPRGAKRARYAWFFSLEDVTPEM